MGLQLMVWKATEVHIRLLDGSDSSHLIWLPTHFSNKFHLKLSRFLKQLRHFSHSLFLSLAPLAGGVTMLVKSSWGPPANAANGDLQGCWDRQTKGEADHCAEGKSGVLRVSKNVQGVPLFLNRQCCFGRFTDPSLSSSERVRPRCQKSETGDIERAKWKQGAFVG